MNRSVLIVTPFFAPQNHAAVFRAYKLAKYLPQFGWNPVVLTVDTQYEFNEEAGLLADLPDEVTIVRTRYIEPTLRGLRMALGGRSRTFQATKPCAAARTRGSVKGSMAERTYHYLIKNWFQIPDAYWTWARTASSAAARLMRERDIRLVYTSSSPYSSLAVGRKLQKAGARWVADFRDPLAHPQMQGDFAPHVSSHRRKLVGDALAHADAVTVLSSSYRSMFREVFGNTHPDPVFIPTGMDEELLDPKEQDMPARDPYLIFAGEYLPQYDNSFLEAFAQAVRLDDVATMNVKLLVVGTLELNQKRLNPLIDKLGLHQNIEFADQMPQKTVYKLLHHARAGVLVPGTQAFWWTNFAKMTDYIGMRKPVLAIVPDPSEARTALTRCGLGVFLDGSTEHRVEILADFLRGKHKTVPEDDECERYTACQQVQSFAKVFDSLSQRRGESKQ